MGETMPASWILGTSADLLATPRRIVTSPQPKTWMGEDGDNVGLLRTKHTTVKMCEAEQGTCVSFEVIMHLATGDGNGRR